MIVKWEDEEGQSFFDYVVHVSTPNAERSVKMTQATLDNQLVARNYTHGTLTVLSDNGVVITEIMLGPKRNGECPAG